MKHIYMSILKHLYGIGDIEETTFYGKGFAHIEFSDDDGKRYSVSIREIEEEEDENNG